MTDLAERSDYAVVVQAEPPGCTWIVNRADRRTLSGRAPDVVSAQRRGAFAAGALHALDRISRRGF
jgi:hypothetical protein